mgnify:CR=1 FL=1
MNKQIALYGGTFSPPHLGHASVIEALLRLFPCDEVWVMPSADRHDKTVTASGEHRVKMLDIMIAELFPKPKISILISDFELRLNKPTVTYETLKLLKEKYLNHEFHFVIGSENLGVIETKWINGKKLFQEAGFIAIKNPLVPLPNKLPPHITIINDVAWSDISSTFVRKLLAQGYSGLPYLTKGVAEYIKDIINNNFKK